MCVEKWLVSYCQSCCLTLCFSGFYTIITHCFLSLSSFTFSPPSIPLTINTLVWGFCLDWKILQGIFVFIQHTPKWKRDLKKFIEIRIGAQQKSVSSMEKLSILLITFLTFFFRNYFNLLYIGICFLVFLLWFFFCTSETEMRYNHFFEVFFNS